MNARAKRGFTLIELIVIIVVLGLLAGAAIPMYSSYVKKAGEASDLQLLSAVNTAFAAACAEHGIDPRMLNAGVTVGADGVSLVSKDTGVNEAFRRYFRPEDQPRFRNPDAVGWNSQSGSFTQGSETITDPGSGATVQTGDLNAYNASGFAGANGDLLVLLASLLNRQELSGGAASSDIPQQVQESLGMTESAYSAMNDIERGKALLFFTASQADTMDVGALIDEYETTGDVASLYDDTGDTLADTAALYALLYGYLNDPEHRPTDAAALLEQIKKTDLSKEELKQIAATVVASEDFQNYMASGHGEQDMKGFVALMKMLNGNAGVSNLTGSGSLMEIFKSFFA